MHIVYIIECINGAYYTGYTTDITRRYQEHQAGSSKCKYTRAFPPKKLVKVWEFDNKSDALRFEIKIKSLTRPQKELLFNAQ
ncbi:MAG: GIY-YIG nuclease family protein [Gammaproteobacteria bacterium]|nr:GIY-YIG nuclease family protein [Gammaproteobacteria bacterium]